MTTKELSFFIEKSYKRMLLSFSEQLFDGQEIRNVCGSFLFDFRSWSFILELKLSVLPNLTDSRFIVVFKQCRLFSLE